MSRPSADSILSIYKNKTLIKINDNCSTYATLSRGMAPAPAAMNAPSKCRKQKQVQPQTPMIEAYVDLLYTPVKEVFGNFVYLYLSSTSFESDLDVLRKIAKMYNLDDQKINPGICDEFNSHINKRNSVIDVIIYILDRITWTSNNARREKQLVKMIKPQQNPSSQQSNTLISNTLRIRKIQTELGLQKPLTQQEWVVMLKLLLHMTFPTFQKDCQEVCTKSPCSTGDFLKAILDESQVEIKNKPLREILCIRKGAIQNAARGAQGGEGDCYTKMEQFRYYVKETFGCTL